jgi:hypothetical protein
MYLYCNRVFVQGSSKIQPMKKLLHQTRNDDMWDEITVFSATENFMRFWDCLMDYWAGWKWVELPIKDF